MTDSTNQRSLLHLTLHGNREAVLNATQLITQRGSIEKT